MKNGILSADYKVTGGKLLRVRLSLTDSGKIQVINTISITGDFFMHPEDAIEELESALIGVAFLQSEITDVISAFYSGGVEVIGAEPADFIHVIMSVC